LKFQKFLKELFRRDKAQGTRDKKIQEPRSKNQDPRTKIQDPRRFKAIQATIFFAPSGQHVGRYKEGSRLRRIGAEMSLPHRGNMSVDKKKVQD
jgi:hypothetical protein